MSVYQRTNSLISEVKQQTDALDGIKSPQAVGPDNLMVYSGWKFSDYYDIHNAGSVTVKVTATFTNPSTALLRLTSTADINSSSGYSYSEYTYFDPNYINSTTQRVLYHHYQNYSNITTMSVSFGCLCVSSAPISSVTVERVA